MYHIYDKSLLACVIPSITTAGLFGNFTRWLLALCFLIIDHLIAIGVGLLNQLRHLNTPADLKASSAWAAACFCVTLL